MATMEHATHLQNVNPKEAHHLEHVPHLLECAVSSHSLVGEPAVPTIPMQLLALILPAVMMTHVATPSAKPTLMSAS